MQGCTTAAELAPAFAQWKREPVLAAALLEARHGHLVLDGSDGRVRHVSPEAARLGAALAGLDGAALARQLAVACPTEGGHRLARLRLDPRRISPPALFTLSRATDAQGQTVFLALPSAAVALSRAISPSARAKTEAASPQPVAPPPIDAGLRDALHPGDRFLWASDATGALTRLTGPLGVVSANLVGQTWPRLIEEGRAGPADTVSAAFEGRRTFRRLPVALRLGGLTVDVDLSGAPAGREGAEFRGFEGFGVIRIVGESATNADTARALPPVASPPPVDDIREPQQAAEAAAVPEAQEAKAVADMQVATEIAEILEAEAADVLPDGALSTDEHAAFREIARALGARYAGDEAASDEERRPERVAGSIMPFPSLRPDLSPATPRSPDEGGGLLDSLPMAAIVHRGELILAVNRPFLDLVRFPDMAALTESGLDAIFPSGAPAFRSGQSHETAIGTAGGNSRPVEVTRGICVWEGGPAAILLLRSLEENDPRRELAAERLAREVQAGRALGAEAALDALQAGVVTIDRDGRVVTLNRAAAACFGASPSEIVGSSFASLFEAGSGATLDAMFSGGEAPSAVLAQGRAMTLALAPPRADGHRVAVLHRLPESTAPVPAPAAAQPVPAPKRPQTLARLDRELREPVSAILGLTTAMLEERFGALGDRRYRACLSDIREAGKRIAERVAALSDLAAVEAGQIDLDPRPLALNELVAGCVSVLQNEAAKGRIVLRTSFSADLAELEADEASVRKAASLVIEHAIRRSVAGGQVIVSTGTGESAEVALRVRDGSPSQDEPEKGPEDEDLRLALPRALVQANGGRLRLAGRGEEGTLVEILLPVRRSLRS